MQAFPWLSSAALTRTAFVLGSLRSAIGFAKESSWCRVRSLSSPGRGDVDLESVIRALNQIRYQGPLSIQWADAGMSRDVGVPEALGFTGDLDFVPGDGVVDEAFGQGD